MRSDARRPRPPRRRRYPLSAYLPFTLMVAVPVILLILLVWLVSRLVAAPGYGATPAATATSPVPVVAPLATQTHAAVSTGPAPTATVTLTGSAPTVTRSPAMTATQSVTIAGGATAAGAPIGAGTVFHGRHTQLWAFVAVPNVHAGDTIRFVWHDLDRNTVVENYPAPVQVNAARYQTRMYAYLGSSPTHPFPADHYRVDVFRGQTPVGTGAFRIVP